MPVSVVIVDEAFLNDRRLQHTGVLLYHTVGGIPTVVLLGYNEDGKIFEFPQDEELMTPELETGQIFINQELRIFGLIYNDDHGEVKIFTVFLASSLNHYDDEIKTLHNIFKKLCIKKSIFVTKNCDEFNNFFAGYGPTAHKIFKKQIAGNKAAAETKHEHALAVSRITTDQFYYQGYANFIEKHPLNSQDATKLIRDLDNLPKFAMETLQFNWAQNIYQLAAHFLQNHLCGNRDCGGFSFTKCSKCNTVHYCSRYCQIQDFPRHKKLCSWFDQISKSKKSVSSKLHRILSSSQDGSETELIEMDVFVREIMLKAYSMFHETFAKGINKSVHAKLIYLLIAHNRHDVRIEQIKWIKMDQLFGKGKQAEKFNKVLKHLQMAHDVSNARFQRDYGTTGGLPQNLKEMIDGLAKGLQFTVTMNQESNPGKKEFMKMIDNEIADEVKKIRDIKL